MLIRRRLLLVVVQLYRFTDAAGTMGQYFRISSRAGALSTFGDISEDYRCAPFSGLLIQNISRDTTSCLET